MNGERYYAKTAGRAVQSDFEVPVYFRIRYILAADQYIVSWNTDVARIPFN